LFYRKALALYAGGKYDSAYATVQHSTHLLPERIDYFSLAALSAYHLKQNNDALTFCKKILSHNPHNINALLLYGIILRDGNDLPSAMGKFNECLKMRSRQY
jgi:tetratricopeptide (TPR) repeat protein